MKNQDKPKMAMKKTVTKVVAKPTSKMMPAKVTVKTTKTVVKPKIEVKKSMSDNTRVKKPIKDFTPAPKYKYIKTLDEKYKPTPADSANYRVGYKVGAVGRDVNPILNNFQRAMGQMEGMDYFKNKSKKKK
jgi:hypothetical protein